MYKELKNLKVQNSTSFPDTEKNYLPPDEETEGKAMSRFNAELR
jgi:hypothetical protein